MKARDIVPGWPKGRSTSVFIWRREALEFYRRVWTNETDESIEPSLKEIELNVLYHEAQQRMVTEHFEEWRCHHEQRRFETRFRGARPVRIASG